MAPTRFVSAIPVHLECPEPMRAAIKYVFDGEYESHLDGSDLDILDVGANIGSFAIWASLRWPSSRVQSFEPNPGTFELLARNTKPWRNITITNAALYPGVGKRQPFFSRFAGDGEAGLAAYAVDTFREAVVVPQFEVDVIDPASLPSADIVKLDIEGGEAMVLDHLDLSRTSLVLLEFQNRKQREQMQRRLTGAGFTALLDEECPWDPILDYLDYRQDLKGDVYGRMFYVRQGQTRLTHRPPS